MRMFDDIVEQLPHRRRRRMDILSSSAGRVQLDRMDKDHIRVLVSDEGVGFDPAKFHAVEVWEAGRGLLGIRDRRFCRAVLDLISNEARANN